MNVAQIDAGYIRVHNVRNSGEMGAANWKKIYDTINSGNPDISRGFTGWQLQCQTVHNAILEARAQMEKERAELAEIFSAKEVQRRIASREKECEDIVRLGKEKLSAALATVIEDKRQQFRKIALSPPSPEDLRLLQAMSLRDDLTPNEIAAVAESMGSNLQSLKALGAIARKAGFDFPHTITADEVDKQLADAEEYSRGMLAIIGTPNNMMTYHQRTFWDKTGTGISKILYDPLDSPNYIAVQEQTKESKGSTEKMPAESTSTGVKWTKAVVSADGFSPSSVAEQFHVSTEQLRAANPGVDLRSLKQGDTVLIPSTRMKMWSGVKYAVQENQVEIVDAPPLENYPAGFGETKDLASEN